MGPGGGTAPALTASSPLPVLREGLLGTASHGGPFPAPPRAPPGLCPRQTLRVPLLPPPLGQAAAGCPCHGEAPAVSLLGVCSQVGIIPAQVSSEGNNTSGSSASIPSGCPVLGREEAELKLCLRDVFPAVVSRIRSDSLAPLLFVCSCCGSSSELMR